MRRRQDGRDAALDPFAQFRIWGLRRHVHAQVDDRQTIGRETLLIRDDPPPHETSASGPGLDQTLPPCLVEGARHGREIDAQRLREKTLRGKAMARLQAAGLDVPEQGLGDCEVFGPGTCLDCRLPGKHVLLTPSFRQCMHLSHIHCVAKNLAIR